MGYTVYDQLTHLVAPGAGAADEVRGGLEAAAESPVAAAAGTAAMLLRALASAEPSSNDAATLTNALRTLPVEHVQRAARRNYRALRNSPAWELVLELELANADDSAPEPSIAAPAD